MKTLELFNAVVAKKSRSDVQVYVSQDGFVVVKDALWALDKILAFYRQQKLSGNDLNKTFHKSWQRVQQASRSELALHQIVHYLSTYGTNFQGEVYIPDEVLDVPDLQLKFKVVRAFTVEEMTDKCLNLLRSGIALKSETVDTVLSVLTGELSYTFTGKENIRNNEAIVKIADLYGVLPEDTLSFFRYVIYRATGDTLLIKNKKSVEAIKQGKFNPGPVFERFGLRRLAQIFNRFKPLFLAFKGQCPRVINRISKLSKVYHEPLVQNPLNEVTHRLLSSDDMHWLDNATPFALFKALSACWSRAYGQTAFVYRIRNGKSWVTENNSPKGYVFQNFTTILDYMRGRFGQSFEGLKVYIPEDVDYALPTSEKMFVGNIPTGTKFRSDKIAAGIYWENAWGARDIDLSGLTMFGDKIGWNASYNSHNLTYSGDITNAQTGAVEYLYSRNKRNEPVLIQANIFSGSDNAGYKIIVGRGDKVTRPYMMNPNNLFMEVKTEAVQRQTIIGMLTEHNEFVLLNFGAGNLRVSGDNHISLTANKALAQQWTNSLSFGYILAELGAEIVESPDVADVDLSLDKLDRDSFTKLFDGSLVAV